VKKIAAAQSRTTSFRRDFAAAKVEFASVGARWQAEPGRVSFASGRERPDNQKSAFQPSRNLKVDWEQAMSIFGKIMSAIFGSSATATPAGGAAAPAGGAGGGMSATPAGGGGAASAAPAKTVDVAPILDKAVAAKREKLEWRTSIVDLMKALDIDSSLGARKELAKELGYTGDTNDSASMNVWLHKQVMAKLAANGGKLPPEIKH
jgi:hypothetical protein